MTTLEQRIEAVERAEEYYRESMGPRPLISSPDVRVYDALRDAVETLRAMQWRDDMENAPEGELVEVSYRSRVGSAHRELAYRHRDGLWRDTRGGKIDVYAWRTRPDPAPLPQGEGE